MKVHAAHISLHRAATRAQEVLVMPLLEVATAILPQEAAAITVLVVPGTVAVLGAVAATAAEVHVVYDYFFHFISNFL